LQFFFGFEKLNLLDKSKNIVYASIFDVCDKIIIEVDKEFLILTNYNYLSLWLLSKVVKELYVEKTDEQIKIFLEKIGVQVKTFAEIKDSPIFKAFMT
jgi:hypothetical protein